MTSYLPTVRVYFEPPKLNSFPFFFFLNLIYRHDSVSECQGNAEPTLLLPWQRRLSKRKGKCSVCSACASVWWTNMAMCRDSTQAALPTPPPMDIEGFSEKSRNPSVWSLCCGSLLCGPGTRLPLSGPTCHSVLHILICGGWAKTTVAGLFFLLFFSFGVIWFSDSWVHLQVRLGSR